MKNKFLLHFHKSKIFQDFHSIKYPNVKTFPSPKPSQFFPNNNRSLSWHFVEKIPRKFPWKANIFFYDKDIHWLDGIINFSVYSTAHARNFLSFFFSHTPHLIFPFFLLPIIQIDSCIFLPWECFYARWETPFSIDYKSAADIRNFIDVTNDSKSSIRGRV